MGNGLSKEENLLERGHVTVLAGEKIEFLSDLGGEHREQRKEKMNSIKKGKNKGQSEIEIDERFSSPIGWVDPTEVPLGKIINHYQTVLDDDDDPVWRLMKGLSEEVLKKKLGDPGKEVLGSENETYQVTYDKKTGKHKWEYRGINIYENSRIYPGPMTKEEIWRWRSRYE
ncbi:hypothetical protein DFJ73DRAFT_762196 [Zopfochytrium polystomum]|nr:hypothetical protein DFJ73DRAFT_762194 [Zopfochytrium polystomum]KAI9342182.1 hypothetical protein DFJ73DRAFT_762196 [Zopfochytrium polystomum]